MGLAVHVACMEGKEMHTDWLWRNLKERNHLDNLGFYSRIMLKWILKKSVERAWT